MALLFNCSPSFHSSPSNTISTRAPQSFFSLNSNAITLQPRPSLGPQARSHVRINYRNAAVIVRASSSPSDVDGTEATPLESPKTSSDNKQQSVSIENLPLESKLQEKADQKEKMKIAKKIRLRRKRLVRKRHLRKKGRWPPSKLKKNKNV